MRGKIVYEGCLWRISAVLDMWGRMISEMAQREKRSSVMIQLSLTQMT